MINFMYLLTVDFHMTTQGGETTITKNIMAIYVNVYPVIAIFISTPCHRTFK